MSQITVQMDVCPSRVAVGQRVAESVWPIIKEALTELVLNNFKDRKAAYAEVAKTVTDGAHELVDFLHAAIRCNTVVENVGDWAGWQGLANDDWQNRQTLLPTLILPEADQSLTGMVYNSFSLPLTVRSGQLENLLAKTATAISNYLGELIQRGMMGFLDHHEKGTAAYSFIRRRIKVQNTKQVKDIDHGLGSRVGYRPENPNDSKTIYACMQTRWGTAEYSTKETIHYLQKAMMQPFQTHQEPMPIWLQPLKQVTPDWLSPYLRVITGTIIEESVSYQEVKTRRWTLPDVKKVKRASPAILFGHATLAGWSDADFGIDFDDRRDYEEFISPSAQASSHGQHQRKSRTQNVNPLPFLIGAAMLFLPFAWPVRIGAAIIGTTLASAVTNRNKK